MKHTVEEVKLKNGAEGLIINIPDASVVCYEFTFRAGDYLAPENKIETPHLMEHLLLGANKKYPKAKLFQAELEKNGAYSNASTDPYHISYEVEAADFEWERVLELLLLSISEPMFLQDEFLAEKSSVFEELTARSNNHFRTLNLNLKNKFGMVCNTDKERLAKLDNVAIDDIVNHYKLTHYSSNLRFICAGDFKSEKRQKLIEIIENELKIPKGEKQIDLPDERPHKLNECYYIQNKTVDNIYFIFETFKLTKLNDDEIDDLTILNNILTETLYSRIMGEAREKGLVYMLWSGFSELKNCSGWWIGGQVSHSNRAELFELIKGELQRILDGDLSCEDLEAAKTYALGRFKRSAQTASGILNGYSRSYNFDNKIISYSEIPERIKRVTTDRVVGTLKKMFEANTWGVGILGTASQDVCAEIHEQLGTIK